MIITLSAHRQVRMNTTITLHGFAVALLLVALGCDGTERPTEITARTARPAPKSAPTPSAPARPMATVNGEAVPMDPLQNALLEDYGLATSQQIIADVLVKQALQKQGLTPDVTQADTQAENLRALSKIFQFDTASPTPSQMEEVLDQLLARKNLTRRVWDQAMRRNAQLAKLAASRVTVTEQDLRDEFFAQYDGKLRCRHIQVPDASTAQTVLNQAQQGADFEQLAFKYSTHPDAKTGAFLPPIGPRTAPPEVPPVLVATARALKEPGQLSNIVQVGSNFHVLKLEEILPPTSVDYDAVKPQLHQAVRDRKIDQLQQRIMRELIREANIVYHNPVLREQYKRVQQK